MKIYNEEFVQKVFEVTDWDYIAVDSHGTLLGFNEKTVVTKSSYWSGCGNVITNNIYLNGMDWKDSLRVRKWVPKKGDIYLTIMFSMPSLTVNAEWCDSLCDKHLLSENLVFKPEEVERVREIAKRMLEVVKK